MNMDSAQAAVMDMLSTATAEARRYTDGLAVYVDGNFDRAADAVREQLAAAAWVPEQLKDYLPRPRAPPTALELAAAADMGWWERVQDWVARHRVALTLAALVSGGLAARHVQHALSARKVRRARRAATGARCEVVVIAASPALPVTQSLALDLERRGFVVYVVCGSADDEQAVRQLARPDIQPLVLDISDTAAATAALERFAHYLHAPHTAVPGARRSHLQLAGVVLVPSLNYTTSPIAAIPPSSFADLFNTHLLHPILTIQLLLPLLTARTVLQPGAKPVSLLSAASSLSSTLCASGASAALGASAASGAPEPAPAPAHKTADSLHVPAPPKVLVFTPSVIASVNPPFHAPEATVCSALTAFTEVLAGELRPLGIPVTHVQLGTFDFSGFAPVRSVAAHRSIAGRMPLPAAETMSWPAPARHVYARNFTAQSTSALGSGRAVRGLRGTAMRDLHHAVFDVLDGSDTRAVVRVGLGASLYGFIGTLVPRGLVAWMMGVRRVDNLADAYQPAAPAVPVDGDDAHEADAAVTASATSSAVSTASETASEEPAAEMKASHTSDGFVAVDELDPNVWSNPSVVGL